jgi:hypothetical protein
VIEYVNSDKCQDWSKERDSNVFQEFGKLNLRIVRDNNARLQCLVKSMERVLDQSSAMMEKIQLIETRPVKTEGTLSSNKKSSL